MAWFLLTSSVPNLTGDVNRKFFVPLIFATSSALEAHMQVAWMLFSSLGTLFGLQICSRAHSLRVISLQTLARTRLFLFPLMILIFFLLRNHFGASVLAICLLHFFPFMLMLLNQHRRRQKFIQSRIGFLDEIILKMRTGKAFRESFREVAAHPQYSVSLQFGEMLSQLHAGKNDQVSTNECPEFREMMMEVRKWDSNQMKTVERIRSYRTQLKEIEKFRQKSSQVIEQIRGQMVVCALLYGFLLIWTLWKSDLASILIPMTISIALFSLGTYFMSRVKRSFKWK